MAPKISSPTVFALLAGSLFAATSFGQELVKKTLPGATIRSSPFQPGLRWSMDATVGNSWIPRSVDFAVQGELVWAAPAVANPHLMLASTSDDPSAEALFEDHKFKEAIGPVLVRAGDQVGELFSLAQFSEGSSRHSVVKRHDPRVSAIDGGEFRSSWTYHPGVTTNRPSLMECGPTAEYVVCATFDGSEVLIDWIDSMEGTREVRASVTGTGLSALSISESTGRVAVVAGLDLWMIDRTGTVLLHNTLQAGTKALALSADGKVLAYGDFGQVHVFTEVRGSFREQTGVSDSKSLLPTQIALDDSGSTLAIGWWDVSTGTSIALEVWDLNQDELLVSRQQNGVAGGPQNFPEAVLLSADGSRAAFGLWGLDDPQPDFYLVDVASDMNMLAQNLPGSVQAMALDESGTRVVLGVKHSHANTFSTTGSVMLFDSGERELQLLSQPMRGGQLSAIAKSPDQIYTVLVIGYEGTHPTVFDSWKGAILLDPNQPYLRRGMLPDRNGFSTLQLKIPDLPELVGVEFGLQAVFLSRAGVSTSNGVLRPVIF